MDDVREMLVKDGPIDRRLSRVSDTVVVAAGTQKQTGQVLKPLLTFIGVGGLLVLRLFVIDLPDGKLPRDRASPA